MKFLSARWSNLFLATYAVPESLLRPRVPPGLELDRRDGQCFVSLVAFDFQGTKVFGIPWPGFREFPELNLRFYVRHGDQRGVVFIREFVPKAFVSWVANTFYNERYATTTMTSAVHEDEREVTAVHRLDWAGRMHTITAIGTKPAIRPSRDSLEHFFKEHEWGFNISHKGKTMRYRVEHPAWDVYPLRSYEIDLDWAAVYGAEWKFLQDAQPYSVMLVAGSKVVVHSGQKLEEPIKPGK